MAISLKTEHIKRYRDIARLFMKYGRSDLVKRAGLAEFDGAESIQDQAGGNGQPACPEAKELAADLEKLGPTFVKLGQLLSTRADILPLPYVEALARLQDNVEPFPFTEVEQTVTAELGVRISKAFAHFEAKPLAAASLGQVHSAVLRSGRPVAVKVQRPGIRGRIVDDLEAMMEIAGVIDGHTETGRRYEFQRMLEEFRKSLFRELDYRNEALNLQQMGKNMEGFRRIVVPQPVEDYSTARVLTMDLIRGTKITALSPVVRIEIDGAALAEELFRAYLQQILVDGFFHADPHPGNVFLTGEGDIALLDLGMTARISPGMQEKLLQLLLAMSEGRAEDAATVAISVGEVKEGFDEQAFRRAAADFVTRNQDVTVGRIAVGRTLLELTRVSGEHGIRPPAELMMLGKTLLNLDQVANTLDPHFDPNAAVRRNSVEIMRRRMTGSLAPGNLFARLIETKDFVERLPGRINKILDSVANNRLEVKVNAIDETHLMEGLQKIANRITIGLLLAALIVGAAMLMQVPTRFRILGYPGLAILFFIVAAGGGIAMMLNIFFYDEKRR